MKTRIFFLSLAVLAAAVAGCQKYDDSELRDALDAQEQRITALETIVNALSSRDYVQSVTPLTEGGETVGYTIVFAQNGEITIMMEKAGYTVEVREDEVVFTFSDGTVVSIPRYAGEHFDLPTSLILPTEEISDVIKKDTVTVDLIVNPSDFPLTKEQVTLMVANDLYTRFETTYPEDSSEGIETPFDETAHCDYEIVDLSRNELYEGAYRLSIVVDGEGNFYNEASAYVVVAATDHDGKVHYTCSNTPFKLHVIPSIEEGLVLDCPQQSFYALDNRGTATDSLKTHYAILWSNRYKNAGGAYKVYDRAKIDGIEIAAESSLAASTAFDYSSFQTQGLLKFNPNENSAFWTDALAAYKENGKVSATVEDAAITIHRGFEAKTLPVNYKTFFGIQAKHDISLTVADIQAADRKYSVDLTEDFAAAGNDATFTSLYKMSDSDNLGATGGRCVVSEKDCSLIMDFYSVKPTTEPFVVICTFFKMLDSIQNPDGSFSALPPTERYSFVNHRIDMSVSISE